MKSFWSTLVSAIAARLLLALMCMSILVAAVSCLGHYRPAPSSSQTNTVVVTTSSSVGRLTEMHVTAIAVDRKDPAVACVGCGRGPLYRAEYVGSQ